jgi:hypothetical protein
MVLLPISLGRTLSPPRAILSRRRESRSASQGAVVAASRDFRRIAMSLEGTSEAPHFDRTAFKATRIYATLAADGLTANVKFLPEEQAFKCMMAPQAFAPVANAWGRQGWTTISLAAIDVSELRGALEAAWRHATRKKTAKKNQCTN